MPDKRGRPKGGDSGARERILQKARILFLKHGYQGTTLRSIASSADVDVALISYHFRLKEGLFATTMALVIGPSEVLDKALKGPLETLPERFAQAIIRAWEAPDLGNQLVTFVTATMHNNEVLRALRGYIEREIIGRLIEQIGGTQATERTTAVATAVVGVIFGRYILQIEPLHTMSSSQLASVLAKQLRAALGTKGQASSVRH